jgi:uncharacterized membrane protein
MNTFTYRTLLSWLGWMIVITAGMYYIANNALHYFTSAPQDESLTFWTKYNGLLVHIVCGMIAISVGPFQFIERIRNRYLHLHRIGGRVYVICVLAGSLAAFYLAAVSNGSFTYCVGLSGLAFVWLTSTMMAYISIRNGKITQHREWMVRSYVITCGFTTFRFFAQLLGLLHISTFPERFAVMSWACWAIPLFITEVILQSRKAV